MAMTRSAVPVGVAGLPSPPVSLACGSAYTCARLSDSSVHCWGSNNSRVLAAVLPGGMTYRATPGPVPGLSAASIASGLSSMCAVRGDGLVACWGAGFAGQLGDLGVVSFRAMPQPVAGVTGAVGVTGGALHHCAWSGAGMQCWGTNGNNQLGDDRMRDPSAAVPVATLTRVDLASGGYLHTCAIHGGGLSCWGDNHQGACGAPPGANLPRPTTVALPAAPTALAAGGGATPEIDDPSTFTCAIVAGAPLGWGSNQVGELGDGASFSSTPVAVMLPAP